MYQLLPPPSKALLTRDQEEEEPSQNEPRKKSVETNPERRSSVEMNPERSSVAMNLKGHYSVKTNQLLPLPSKLQLTEITRRERNDTFFASFRML